MPGFPTRRPDDHHHSIGEESDRLEARFAIVPPRILHGNCRTGKDDRCISELQAALVKSSPTLHRVERDFHFLSVPPFNRGVNDSFRAGMDAIFRGDGA